MKKYESMNQGHPPYTIGILVNNIGYFVYTVCTGMSEATESRGWNSVIMTLPPVAGDNTQIYDASNFHIEDNKLISSLNQIDLMGLDGLIIHYDVADFANAKLLEQFFKDRPNLKGASIGSKVAGIPLVITDNFQSQYNAIEHLIKKHNNSKILYLRGPFGNEEAEQRFQGYVQCLEDNGIEYDPSLVIQGSFFMKSGSEAIKMFLEQYPVEFDAIASANDNMLAGAITVLLDRGYDIPGDIDVVGFDNNIYAQNFGFTTIEQSYEELAELAIQEIEHQFLNNVGPEDKMISVAGPLVIGKYCGCPNEKSLADPLISEYLDEDKKALERLIQSRSAIRFNSKQQKVLFFKSLEELWFLVTRFLKTNQFDSKSIQRIRRQYAAILQKLIIINSNLTPWQSIIKDLKRDALKLTYDSDCLLELFDQLQMATEDSVDRAFTQIRRTSEALGYEIMSLGHRLVGSPNIDEIFSSFSMFMGVLSFQKASIVLYQTSLDHIENITDVRFISITDLGSDEHKVDIQPEVSVANLRSELRASLNLNARNAVSNLIMLPIGIKNQYFGFCLAEVSSDSEHWPLYRSMQIYLSQALFNIEKVQLLIESEEKYKAASRAKTSFLSRMTHELRTPMNGVIGMTSLLMDTDVSNDQLDYITTIRKSGDAMLGLISEILDFSKIESESLSLECTDFDLATTIEEALDLVSGTAKEKNIQLDSFVDISIPSLISQDGSRVRQVILNLLSNAVKFTRQGFVNVTAGLVTEIDRELLIELRITDTGIGIRKDQIATLFKPFSQADKNTHIEYGGTGLGLAISKNIAQQLQGDLVIVPDSESGTTFKFTFMAKRASQLNYLEASTRPIVNNDAAEYLMNVVSDNTLFRKTLRQAASVWNIKIKTWRSLSQFLSSKKPNSNQCLVVENLQETAEYLKQTEDLMSQKGVPCFLVDYSDSNCHSIKTLKKPFKVISLYRELMDAWGFDSLKQKGRVASEFIPDHAKDYPLSILLAEDNPVNQKVAVSILKKCGYRVDVVANGIEAIEAVKQGQYQVILMDILMPEMDGTEATRKIRELPEQIKQPYIIALTANAQAGDREKMLALGMNDYVSKPIVIRDLLSSLKRAYNYSSWELETSGY